MTTKAQNPIGAALVYPPHLVDNIPEDSDRYRYAKKPICTICLDDGVVALLGTQREGRGPTYDRGCAPCLWCQMGSRRTEVWKAANEKPLTDYTLEDIAPPSVQIDWRDAEQRLKADEAWQRAREAWRSMRKARDARTDEIKHGAPSAAPAARPFG